MMKTILRGMHPLSKAGMLSGLVALAITSGMTATQVELNGRRLALSVPPTQVSGRTMVPMRDIFESLGAEVQWNETTRTATADKGDNNVQISIGSSRAIVNGRSVPLDVPAMIIHGSTMVPLRFVSEALGADVKWSSATQMVSITTSGTQTAGQYQQPIISSPVSLVSTQAVVIPAGIVIPVSLDNALSSATNHVGDPFTVTVRSSRNGDAEFPRGTQMGGTLSQVQLAGKGQPGMLDLSFRGVSLPDGRRMAVTGSLISLDEKNVTQTSDGRLVATEKKSSSNDSMKFIAIGAGAGLLIGKLLDNTLLGGLLGAAGGYFYNESQKKDAKPQDVTVAQGTEFGVRLDSDLGYRSNSSFVLARADYLNNR